MAYDASQILKNYRYLLSFDYAVDLLLSHDPEMQAGQSQHSIGQAPSEVGHFCGNAPLTLM